MSSQRLSFKRSAALLLIAPNKTVWMSIPRRVDTADVVCRSRPMTFGGKELSSGTCAVRMDLSAARLGEGAGTRGCILCAPCASGRLLTTAGLRHSGQSRGCLALGVARGLPTAAQGAAGGHADVLTDYHDSCATLKFLKLT